MTSTAAAAADFARPVAHHTVRVVNRSPRPVFVIWQPSQDGCVAIERRDSYYFHASVPANTEIHVPLVGRCPGVGYIEVSPDGARNNTCVFAVAYAGDGSELVHGLDWGGRFTRCHTEPHEPIVFGLRGFR